MHKTQQSDRLSAYRRLLGVTSNAHELFFLNWRKVALMLSNVAKCIIVIMVGTKAEFSTTASL